MTTIMDHWSMIFTSDLNPSKNGWFKFNLTTINQSRAILFMKPFDRNLTKWWPGCQKLTCYRTHAVWSLNTFSPFVVFCCYHLTSHVLVTQKSKIYWFMTWKHESWVCVYKLWFFLKIPLLKMSRYFSLFKWSYIWEPRIFASLGCNYKKGTRPLRIQSQTQDV